jgi:COP9 signalosome complex subunit 1
MKPDVSTTKHIIEIGKHLVRVCLQRRDWATVRTNLSKMAGQGSSEEEKALQPYLKITTGIALLGQESYHDAALNFLQIDVPDASQLAHNDIASPNDIAIYGGLLALASMDRKTLRSKVLDNSSFRTFLELEPHIRRAVTQFVNGRYSACLAILESCRPDYLLDIYLQKHIPRIYAQIRSKCITQYLIPFSCVTLHSMNMQFAAPGQSIEEELIAMIKAGALQARINSIDKVSATKSHRDGRIVLNTG